jgi:hypothetical protein
VVVEMVAVVKEEVEMVAVEMEDLLQLLDWENQ